MKAAKHPLPPSSDQEEVSSVPKGKPKKKAAKHPLPASSDQDEELPPIPKRQKVQQRIEQEKGEMDGENVQGDSSKPLPHVQDDGDDVILQPLSMDTVEDHHPAPVAQKVFHLHPPHPSSKSSQIPACPPFHFPGQARAHSRAPSKPPAAPTHTRAQTRPPQPRAGSMMPGNPWGNPHGQFYPMPMYPNAGGMPHFYPPSYPPMMNAYPYGMPGTMRAGPSRIQEPVPYYLEDVQEKGSDGQAQYI